MRHVHVLLSELETFSEYDVRVVSVSRSYVKTEQRVSLRPSSTVQNMVERLFPWIKLDDEDFTVGVGLCTNNEPELMTWNKARLVKNAKIQDLWSAVAPSPNQEYLLVCCQFSRQQYNLQKDRLDGVLEDMGKWIPG